ncbi:MAG TPA: alpha/beta fold hydrolase, partial [Labilithrix sp.]
MTVCAVACGSDPSAPAATDARATEPREAGAADPEATPTSTPGADASLDSGSDGAPSDAGAGPDSALVVARPYNFRVPSGYDATKPTPLVVALHGYADWGAKIDGFGLGTIVDAKGFLYAYPNGSVDLSGNRFWNATDACCNLTFLPVDDVAYLNAVLDDIEAKYNVDPKRIFVVGHSNGGFMSHRFACDAASRVAAIASLGGAQWFDPSRCAPAAKVSVLEVHGDDDQTIHYGGGIAAALYPSAPTTVATWA